MNAPQITLIILWTLSIGLTWAKHGKPETGKHDVWTSLLSVAVVTAILWWGGFWSHHP